MKTEPSDTLHPPFSEGDCQVCHNPHSSAIPGMLVDKQATLCFSCHDGLESDLQKAGSTHPPVTDGQCTKCHNPHKAKLKNLLLAASPDLCLSCHKPIKERMDTERVHSPAGRDCLRCHSSHMAARGALLDKPINEICGECHNLSDDAFKGAHNNIEAKAIDCRTCHEPHASKDPQFFKPVLHPPFAERSCGPCHSAEPSTGKGKDAVLHLNPGARGKLCFECHTNLEGILKKAAVHTPLAKGECTGCHNPHAAKYPRLFDRDKESICYKCHDTLVPKNAKSTHQVVAEGKCVLCHDPHSADNKNNLLKAGKNLCFDCHKELGDKIKANKFNHSPVQNDCLACHDPHASAENDKLLKKKAPDLCLRCHDAQKPAFKKQHLEYPVEKSNCVSCHNPHGSSTAAILWDNVHPPVHNKMCSQCHKKPSSATPFALKKKGYELCQGCHYEMINKTFLKDRLHWPMLDETGCVNCHSPHAAPEKGLLKAPMKEVCGSCHADTIARQDKSPTKHVPVKDGNCMACHEAHASNAVFLVKDAAVVNVCGTCHDWQAHSTHPIGDQIIDPRNPNLTLDCLSCHRSHGTEHEHMLYSPTTSEQCIRCHAQFKR
jgi:predicted CXXCH cytochrome family protein